ncbi:MAG: stage II sporulation protein P [Oscillospiraceae bacterium]|nr:stage II sporulation protein P [Oscillospiraceae bacterium]
MGKIKSLLICAAAVACPIFIATDNSFGEALRSAAYISAGVYLPAQNDSESASNTYKPDTEDIHETPDITEHQSSTFSTDSADESSKTSDNDPNEPEQSTRGTVIRLNSSQLTDDTDYSSFTKHSGAINRFNFGKYSSDDYIDLPSGAQVRNCTWVSSLTLEETTRLLPVFIGDYDPAEPQVLIYHTHTTESFLPEADWYDSSYPTRSLSDERNITSVGDAICEALAARGISSVHDCTVHDYPSFPGAYANSAETIKRNLEQYPSIKIIIDIHRDGIVNADGSLSAPIAEINGKNAAQLMIISGCDDGTMDMPDYLENFKLACLLQNCAENAYPGLARAVLFDYRCYNQNLNTGTLLIEVGSHGNSLNEVVYTGELLGNVIADALETVYSVQ